jgi:hypothetical protein
MAIKTIKSVGWSMEDGIVLDEREGIDEMFEEMFNEGSKVSSFEEGCERVKEFVLEVGDESDWVEVEEKLNELKKLNNGEGWIVWNVEYDCSLGFKEL